MEEIWKNIDNMDEDEKKKYVSGTKDEATISNAYFLNFLDKDHILHPKKTRSVLSKVKGTGVKQLWKRTDKKTGGSHYFKRTVAWNEIRLYKDNNGKEKYVRVTSKFYWKDKKTPCYTRHEIDQELPDNYKLICSRKAGDVVKLEGEEGEWKISELGNRVTLNSLQTNEKKELSYKKLFKKMTYITRKKIVS